MERSGYESRLRNLHSWAGHLGTTIDDIIPRVLAELGPPGEERSDDLRAGADLLESVAESLGDVMGAFDLLVEEAGRPRRYDDFLQSLEVAPKRPERAAERRERAVAPVDRARFVRLAAELNYDAGWLLGAIHGAIVCGGGEAEHLDGHLDGLASGIDEAMISYDRLQDLIGVRPARHNAFFDQMVVIEDERQRRRHRRRQPAAESR